MEGIKKLGFKKVLNTYFNNSFKTKNVNVIIQEFKDIVAPKIEEWKKSNFTDFNLYSQDEYIYDLFLCYYYCSRPSVLDFIRYCEKNNIPKNINILDDYNGIGLSTIHLSNAGFTNVYYYNDCSAQVQKLKELYGKLGLDEPMLVNTIDCKKYDAVLSFEVIEHYTEPIKHVDNLISVLKDDGLLCITTGFSKIHIGHFPTYKFIDCELNIKQAGKKVNMYLASNLTYLGKGWNRLPMYYKKG